MKGLKTEAKERKSKGKIHNSSSMGRLNTVVAEKIAKGYKYDTSLFHKTIFHLKPLNENP